MTKCPFCPLEFDSQGMMEFHARRCHVQGADFDVRETWFRDCPVEVKARSCWPSSLNDRLVYVETTLGNHWRLAS